MNTHIRNPTFIGIRCVNVCEASQVDGKHYTQKEIIQRPMTSVMSWPPSNLSPRVLVLRRGYCLCSLLGGGCAEFHWGFRAKSSR